MIWYNLIEPIFYKEKEDALKIILIKNLYSLFIYIVLCTLFLNEFSLGIRIGLFIFMLWNVQIRVLKITTHANNCELESFEYVFYNKKNLIKFKADLVNLTNFIFITRTNFFEFESKYSIAYSPLSNASYEIIDCDFEYTFNKIKKYIEEFNLKIQK
ncbi:MAG: hypothetical protein RLZZ546_2931 [Bacteroidota bacterium]|jgi:hypothetical protein